MTGKVTVLEGIPITAWGILHMQNCGAGPIAIAFPPRLLEWRPVGGAR